MLSPLFTHIFHQNLLNINFGKQYMNGVTDDTWSPPSVSCDYFFDFFKKID